MGRKVKFLIIVTFGFVLLGCAGDYQAEKAAWKPQKLYDEIMANPRQADPAKIDEAIQGFKQGIEKYPTFRNNGKLELQIGRLYAIKGDYEEAEKQFEQVVQKYGGKNVELFVQATILLGRVSEARGEYDKAWEIYKRLLANLPEGAGNLIPTVFGLPLEMIRTYMRLGEEDKAQQVADFAASIYEQYAEMYKDTEIGALALNYKATLESSIGRAGESLAILNEIEEKYPGTPTALTTIYRKGLLYELDMKDPKEALVYYQKFVEEYPKHTELAPDIMERLDALGRDVYFRMARIYASEKEYNKAAEALEKVIEKWGDSPRYAPRAYLALAGIYEAAGDWEKALDRYKELEQKYEKSSEGLQVPFRIAMHYKNAGDEEKAQEAFKKAIAKYDRMIKEEKNQDLVAAAMNMKVQCLVAQEKWEDAIKQFEEIVEKFPGTEWEASALIGMARIYSGNLGEHEKAAQAYKGFVDSFPNHTFAPLAKMGLAQEYMTLEKYDKAMEIYSKMAEEGGRLAPIAQFGLAVAHDKAGQWENALGQLENLQESFPLTYQALEAPLYIARHYKDAGDEKKAQEAFAKALQTYEKLLEENRDNANLCAVLQTYIGTAYMEQEMWDKAERAFQVILKNYKDTRQVPIAYLRLGEIYKQRGKKEEAKKYLQKLMEEYPTSTLVERAKEMLEEIGSSK